MHSVYDEKKNFFSLQNKQIWKCFFFNARGNHFHIILLSSGPMWISHKVYNCCQLNSSIKKRDKLRYENKKNHFYAKLLEYFIKFVQNLESRWKTNLFSILKTQSIWICDILANISSIQQGEIRHNAYLKMTNNE